MRAITKERNRMELKKTNDLVKYVLKKYPETRSSDDCLYVRVCETVNCESITLPFCVIMSHRKELGIPSFKSVERCRRKLQKAYPELCASTTVEALREIEEDIYKSYGKKVLV